MDLITKESDQAEILILNNWVNLLFSSQNIDLNYF